MRLTSRRIRRIAAAAAIAGAAIALPAAALASSAGTAAPKTAAVTHRCYVSELVAWLGIPGNGAAGSFEYALEISNVSRQRCTLYGFPGLSAVGGGGGQLGSAAGRAAGYSTRLVTLAPFQTAHVDVVIVDAGNYPTSTCQPTEAVALRVYAPGDYGSMVVPFSFQACAKSGPIYLRVSPVFAGTGIPGYLDS